MNVVIVGESVIAISLAEALMARHQVVYVGPPSHEERFQRLDIETVSGTVTAQDTLRQARVSRADAFVACSGSNEQNIIACLAARKMGAKQTICVLTGPGFGAPEEGQTLAESLGIDLVIHPAEQLADEIIRICTVPGALDVHIFERGRVALLNFSVEQGAPATRAPIKSLNLPKEINLVMVRRGDAMIIPRGETELEPGDRAMVMGHQTALQSAVDLFRRTTLDRQARRATVVGAGTVGIAVARGLEKAGWKVKLVEKDRARSQHAATLLDSLVLHGDGADLELLEQENVGETPVLVAVTNNDEKNLLVSLLSKHLGVERIVTRAHRLANERMFEKVGVDVVRSAHGAAIRSILRTIDEPHAEVLAELEHGDACVIELEIPPGFPSRPLHDLRPPALAVVGSLLRKERLIVPRGGDMLKAKDQALIFCLRKDQQQIRSYFRNVEKHRRQVGVE